MFDKLVESTKDKPQGRSKFYLVISAVYGVGLTTLGILTIMWFNPMPAEAYERLSMLAPPVPITPAPITRVTQRAEVAPRNFAPTIIPKDFPDPRKVTPAPVVRKNPGLVIGAPDLNVGSSGPTQSSLNVGGNDEAPVPIPTPKIIPTPTPRPEPIATPTPRPKIIVSDMVTSKAIKKVQPPYPAIARSARVQGAVQVQVLISEEGRVVSASTVNGHPLLLDASLQAARQWVFSPTQLNGTPVKVSGVLTFNFTLN